MKMMLLLMMVLVVMIILQRLKMFVYLHDIDCEEGHPTEVPINKHSISNKFEIRKQNYKRH